MTWWKKFADECGGGAEQRGIRKGTVTCFCAVSVSFLLLGLMVLVSVGVGAATGAVKGSRVAAWGTCGVLLLVMGGLCLLTATVVLARDWRRRCVQRVAGKTLADVELRSTAAPASSLAALRRQTPHPRLLLRAQLPPLADVPPPSYEDATSSAPPPPPQQPATRPWLPPPEFACQPLHSAFIAPRPLSLPPVSTGSQHLSPATDSVLEAGGGAGLLLNARVSGRFRYDRLRLPPSVHRASLQRQSAKN